MVFVVAPGAPKPTARWKSERLRGCRQVDVGVQEAVRGGCSSRQTLWCDHPVRTCDLLQTHPPLSGVGARLFGDPCCIEIQTKYFRAFAVCNGF